MKSLSNCFFTGASLMNNGFQASKEKLIEDCRVVVSDAEELLKATATQAGDKAAAARVKIQESLERAKMELDKAQAVAIDKTKEAARATDQYVHENPWRAVGVSAGIGLIIGLLIGRR
jgi:ElaB/YqjD/DUF883 family membrane-anchored ribosome-binding protein